MYLISLQRKILKIKAIIFTLFWISSYVIKWHARLLIDFNRLLVEQLKFENLFIIFQIY